MKTEKLSNFKVKPLILHDETEDDVLGGKLFKDCFSNTFMISKKKSGKTTVIFHILRKICRGGRFPTNVVIFCSTAYSDPTWQMIIKMLENKGCNVSVYHNFIEKKENILSDLLDRLEKENEEKIKGKGKKEEVRKEDPLKILMFGKKEEEIEEKAPRKPKKKSAPWVFIFDDLGSDLKSETVSDMCKKIRHFGRSIISTQFLTDLTPATRKQCDYCLVFRSFNQDKLYSIWESFDLSVDFEKFVEIYNFATAEPYNFLYIDVRGGTFRKNFNEEIKIDT